MYTDFLQSIKPSQSSLFIRLEIQTHARTVVKFKTGEEIENKSQRVRKLKVFLFLCLFLSSYFRLCSIVSVR